MDGRRIDPSRGGRRPRDVATCGRVGSIAPPLPCVPGISSLSGHGGANARNVPTVPDKLRYEIDLTSPTPPLSTPSVGVRSVDEADLEALAELMLDAYVDTIDYDDEDLEDALDEVRSFFGGTPQCEHSYVAIVDDVVASAILVSLVDGTPFIGYVMTASDYKNQRLARRLATEAITSLAASGYERVVLYITDGNRPSERLFRSVGAVVVESA